MDKVIFRLRGPWPRNLNLKKKKKKLNCIFKYLKFEIFCLKKYI